MTPEQLLSKYTKTELARRADVTFAYVQRWFTSGTVPDKYQILFFFDSNGELEPDVCVLRTFGIKPEVFDAIKPLVALAA